MKTRSFTLLCLAAIFTPALVPAQTTPAATPAKPADQLQAGTYVIDPVHSNVGFKVTHLFSQVPGKFTSFSGNIVVADDPTKNSCDATIQTKSVDTGNTQRDDHLRTPDFFDATKFPTLTFKSTAWKKTGNSTYDVTGDLTMHGVTKPVTMKVNFLGAGQMNGKTSSGWTGAVTIKRDDWGISGGKPIVGDDIVIEINVEADK